MSYATRTVLTLLGVLLLFSPADAREVTRCGITIGPGKTGKLVKDVHCGLRCESDPTVRCGDDGDDSRCPAKAGISGCRPEQIFLERNATLDLNGFDLFPHLLGVVCQPGTRSKCTIKGPGTIHSINVITILPLPTDRDIVLEDLVIDGATFGIFTSGRVTLTSVELKNWQGNQVRARSGLRARNVRTDAVLQSGKSMVLDQVESSSAVYAERAIRGRDVTMTDGGLSAGDLFLTRTTVLTPADDGAGGGFRASTGAKRRIVLRDSSVTGIQSSVKPELARSSCVRSMDSHSGTTWGVCAQD